MIYILEKRHEFGQGTIETHISGIGVFMNGKTLKKGTKVQCEKYCRAKKYNCNGLL